MTTGNGVIQRKLALLDKQVARLSDIASRITWAEFETDEVIQAATERTLQVAAQIVIDIAERLIALNAAGPVATAADALTRIAELGLIASADRYIPIIRFRKLIVHEYDEIDPRIVYRALSTGIDDLKAFRDELDDANAFGT